MRLRFTKMHGCGNDFIIIDGLTQTVKLSPERIRALADRHMGIGCDQLLIVEAPSKPELDFAYRIYNNDGNQVEHCGNGARCFAKFVRDRKLTANTTINVETVNRQLQLQVQNDGCVSVDMGAPTLAPERVPFVPADNNAGDNTLAPATYEIVVDGKPVILSAISMGNPHAVLVVDDTDNLTLEELAIPIQQHPQFPDGVNVGFMQVLSRSEINLRVYERGAGETLACGTGACAAIVAGRLRDLLDETVKVNLLGGTLSIHWPGSAATIDTDLDNQHVIKTGPATTVFHGQVRL